MEMNTEEDFVHSHLFPDEQPTPTVTADGEEYYLNQDLTTPKGKLGVNIPLSRRSSFLGSETGSARSSLLLNSNVGGAVVFSPRIGRFKKFRDEASIFHHNFTQQSSSTPNVYGGTPQSEENRTLPTFDRNRPLYTQSQLHRVQTCPHEEISKIKLTQDKKSLVLDFFKSSYQEVHQRAVSVLSKFSFEVSTRIESSQEAHHNIVSQRYYHRVDQYMQEYYASVLQAIKESVETNPDPSLPISIAPPQLPKLFITEKDQEEKTARIYTDQSMQRFLTYSCSIQSLRTRAMASHVLDIACVHSQRMEEDTVSLVSMLQQQDIEKYTGYQIQFDASVKDHEIWNKQHYTQTAKKLGKKGSNNNNATTTIRRKIVTTSEVLTSLERNTIKLEDPLLRVQCNMKQRTSTLLHEFSKITLEHEEPIQPTAVYKQVFVLPYENGTSYHTSVDGQEWNSKLFEQSQVQAWDHVDDECVTNNNILQRKQKSFAYTIPSIQVSNTCTRSTREVLYDALEMHLSQCETEQHSNMQYYALHNGVIRLGALPVSVRPYISNLEAVDNEIQRDHMVVAKVFYLHIFSMLMDMTDPMGFLFQNTLRFMIHTAERCTQIPNSVLPIFTYSVYNRNLDKEHLESFPHQYCSHQYVKEPVHTLTKSQIDAEVETVKSCIEQFSHILCLYYPNLAHNSHCANIAREACNELVTVTLFPQLLRVYRYAGYGDDMVLLEATNKQYMCSLSDLGVKSDFYLNHIDASMNEKKKTMTAYFSYLKDVRGRYAYLEGKQERMLSASEQQEVQSKYENIASQVKTSPPPFSKSIHILRLLPSYDNVEDMQQCIVRVIRSVSTSIEEYYKDTDTEVHICTDDQIGILGYCIIQAQIPCLSSQLHFLTDFMPVGQAAGETGYSAITLSSSCSFVVSFALKYYSATSNLSEEMHIVSPTIGSLTKIGCHLLHDEDFLLSDGDLHSNIDKFVTSLASPMVLDSPNANTPSPCISNSTSLSKSSSFMQESYIERFVETAKNQLLYHCLLNKHGYGQSRSALQGLSTNTWEISSNQDDIQTFVKIVAGASNPVYRSSMSLPIDLDILQRFLGDIQNRPQYDMQCTDVIKGDGNIAQLLFLTKHYFNKSYRDAVILHFTTEQENKTVICGQKSIEHKTYPVLQTHFRIGIIGEGFILQPTVILDEQNRKIPATQINYITDVDLRDRGQEWLVSAFTSKRGHSVLTGIRKWAKQTGLLPEKEEPVKKK